MALTARKRKLPQGGELDITAFMNLMIVLVPVLLMSMVFSRITVHDLTLPEAGSGEVGERDLQRLELVVREAYIDINFPAGVRLKRVDKLGEEHDFAQLSLVLQEVKRRLGERDQNRRDILILAEPQTDYQTLIAVMDTVRSFDAVVAASVVNAELFPDISLGDAPPAAAQRSRGPG